MLQSRKYAAMMSHFLRVYKLTRPPCALFSLQRLCIRSSASAGGSVDLLTATYGLLFATKAVLDTQGLAIKPEENFSRTF